MDRRRAFGVMLPGEPGALVPVDRAELSGDPVAVAPDLLGSLVVCGHGPQRVVARVVEVEAYREDDPASHSFRGPTPRARVMFGRAGHAYVYVSHGIHLCLNVVCGREGQGAAILLRAARIDAGHALARSRRPAARRDRDLARGPGRLAAALGLTRDMDGDDLTASGKRLWLARDGWLPSSDDIVQGPRTGVRLAADVPWRFHLSQVAEVSPYRRHPRAPRLPPTQRRPRAPRTG